MATDLPKVLVSFSDGTPVNAVTFVPKDSVTHEPFTALEQAIERYDPFQHTRKTWPRSESPQRPRLRVHHRRR